MTAKENAEKLVARFFFIESHHTYIDKQIAVICAKICVDEIIKELTAYGENNHELQNMDRDFAYWEDVKNEIEKI